MLYNFLVDPADVDTDGFVAVATGAGPWTTAGTVPNKILLSGLTPDGLAHQLGVGSSADIAGITITLTGTDADGKVITDTVTGISNSVVETNKYFKTLTNVAADSTLGANTINIGWVDEVVTASLPLNWRMNVTSNWFGDQTGTITWNVDFAIQDPATATEQSLVKWNNPAATLESETADSSAFVSVAAGYTAARVRVASYTDTADLRIYVSQPEVV